MDISVEQVRRVQTLAGSYENFKCVECTQAIKSYLISQGLHGKMIKLYTGASTGPNSFIYDETFPSEAISTNGRHQGIAIIINGIEIVFDNHHPEGLAREKWLSNLLFQGLVHQGQQFQITEEVF